MPSTTAGQIKAVPPSYKQRLLWRWPILKKRILVLDDDLNFCRTLKELLDDETTDTHYVLTDCEMLECFSKQWYCLIIMDIALSDANGVELLKTIRRLKVVPILVISTQSDPAIQAAVLDAGAAAFLSKPCGLDVCAAQARTLMRLYMDLHGHELRCYALVFSSGLIIDPMYRQVTVNGHSLELARKKFDILCFLAQHSSQVLSGEQIYNQVWGYEFTGNFDEAVKSQIKGLRKKLSSAGLRCIETVWGVGYRFVPDGIAK